MVHAAIERRVIMDRGYREAVVGVWWATHLLGQIETQ
jgi:hypothetical protein